MIEVGGGHVRSVCEPAHAGTQEIRACATEPLAFAHGSHTIVDVCDCQTKEIGDPTVCDAPHTFAHKEFRACASVRATPSHTVSHTPCFLRVCECAPCASPKGDGRRVAHATATSLTWGRSMPCRIVGAVGVRVTQ